MNQTGTNTDIKETIRAAMLQSGAVAVGFARAADIGEETMDGYRRWISNGMHAGMAYLSRHTELKRNPRSVLTDAATVISVAFSYAPSSFRRSTLPVIACYAYGKDYHDVIRGRLDEAVRKLSERLGGSWRVCIDSAPVAERYWALKSGIGRNGRNGSVIVENCGCYCFLAEILTSHPVAPDTPSEASCAGCGACVAACPTGALRHDGKIDSARCLSYLTIEHRGEWEGEMLAAMRSDAGKNCLFGCDACLRACPHNRDVEPTRIPEFIPSEEIMTLDADTVTKMTQVEFSAMFKGSPIKRAKLDGLRRNALNILE